MRGALGPFERGRQGRCLWVANDAFATVGRLRPAEPDFAFGHKITQAIDAVLKSIDERRRVRVEEI